GRESPRPPWIHLAVVDQGLLDDERGSRRPRGEAARIDADGPRDGGEPEGSVARPPARGLHTAVALDAAHAVGASVGDRGERLPATRRQVVQVTLGDPEDPLVAGEPEIPETVLEDLVDHVVEQPLARSKAGGRPALDP